MKRLLLVDGQVLQTGARDRGMGKYAICLLQAIKRQQPDLDIRILLSDNLPLDSDVKALLEELLAGMAFVRLDLKTTDQMTIEAAFHHNRLQLDDYVLSIGNTQIDYFIPSLFQEPTVAVFPTEVHLKSVLFHDIIPYLYYERYAPVMRYENYLKRFRFAFEADLVLTNSQTVADDLTIYMGIQKQKLQRIDGAAIHTDSNIQKPAHIKLNKKFILFNTSDDPRKNNLTTVIGFEEFLQQSEEEYELVLTSTINEQEQQRLKQFSDNLIFTGNIPEAELNWLYAHCELLISTPESEGLGLMVLEGVDASKKIVCSAISVYQEISSDAFFYCDHESSYDIAAALGRAANPKATIDQSKYDAIKAHYSWDATAARMLSGVNAFKPQPTRKKPKLAIFTARPSGLSGVGLTNAILHPVMADHFDVEYYLEDGLSNKSIRPDYLRYVAPCYPAQEFTAKRYAQYDAVIYHLGNGDYHLESIKSALTMPGYIVVHDTNLREAYRVLRETGAMSADRVALEEKIDEMRGANKSSYYSSIANRQLGILTHSSYATQAMKQILDTDIFIRQTGLPTNVPGNMNQRPDNKIVIGLAGAIADVKGLDIIEEIAKQPEFENCDIRLFGFNHASKEKLQGLNSYSNVSIATNVSDFDFQTSFAKLDIFVNYRMLYKGETSNTTLEAMRQGVTAIIRDIGWFAELADDVVVKVKSPEAVIDELKRLVKDKKRLKAIGTRAKEYVSTHFTQEQYATAIRDLITHDLANNPNAIVANHLKKGDIKQSSDLLALVSKGHHE